MLGSALQRCKSPTWSPRSSAWHWLWLIGCCAVTPTLARAQAIKLAELEARAVRARPSIGGADARIAEARARVAAAQSAYAPTLNLLAEASFSPGQRLVPFPYDATNPNSDPTTRDYKVAVITPFGAGNALTPVPRYGVSVDLRGNIYDFGRTSAAVDAAMAQHRAAEADAHRTTREIVRDVRAAYVRWATSYALHSLCERALHSAEERKQRAAASIEEGALRSADITAAESDLGFAKLELHRASADLDDAREDVGFMAGIPLGPEAQPADELLQLGAPPPTAANAKSVDPALQTLQEQRSAAKASARVHDHAFTPVLSASAQAGVQGQSGSVFPLYRLVVNMSVPLWDGGGDRAIRSQAEAQAAQLAAQAEEYRAQREHMARRSAASRQNVQQRIATADELVRLCRLRISQLEEGRPLGAATAPDVAAARATLQRAETELVLAQAAQAQLALGLE